LRLHSCIHGMASAIHPLTASDFVRSALHALQTFRSGFERIYKAWRAFVRGCPPQSHDDLSQGLRPNFVADLSFRLVNRSRLLSSITRRGACPSP
jgi:hypothetical protein